MSLASWCERSSLEWRPSQSVAGKRPCLIACFLYWAMFLKASGLNGVDALAIVLVSREERLGRSEEVVEPRCLSGCYLCCDLCRGSQTRLGEREGEPMKAGWVGLRIGKNIVD